MSDPECPLCGEAVRPVDLDFCPSCGAALTGPGDAELSDLATHLAVDRFIDEAIARAEEVRAERIRALAVALEDARDGRRMVGIELAGGNQGAILACGVIVDDLSGTLVRTTLAVALRAEYGFGDPRPTLDQASGIKAAGWRFADIRDGVFPGALARELDPRDFEAVGELVDGLKLLFDAWAVPGSLAWVISLVGRPAEP